MSRLVRVGDETRLALHASRKTFVQCLLEVRGRHPVAKSALDSLLGSWDGVLSAIRADECAALNPGNISRVRTSQVTARSTSAASSQPQNTFSQ